MQQAVSFEMYLSYSVPKEMQNSEKYNEMYRWENETLCKIVSRFPAIHLTVYFRILYVPVLKVHLGTAKESDWTVVL